MYCPHCGYLVSPNDTYCYSCGCPLYQKDERPNPRVAPKKSKKGSIFLSGIFVIIAASIVYTVSNLDVSYYFFDNDYRSDNGNTETPTEKPQTPPEPEKPQQQEINFDTTRIIPQTTVITTTNRFEGVVVGSKGDAIKLIEEDSKNQKGSCPKDIVALEEKISKEFNIVGVNLCEMSPSMAQGTYDVIKRIYNEFPQARGVLTNLSVLNLTTPTEYIAAFMGVYPFVNYNSLNNGASSTYPTVVKTQMLLNTYYFFNTSRLQSAMTNSSNSGHFPPNSTLYSPVAHELGHYLSFIAIMKSYNTDSIVLIDTSNYQSFMRIYNDFRYSTLSKDMLMEAYERDATKGSLTFDSWRGTISKYALARAKNGTYIYDETIAEGFHDYFLNGSNAKPASRMIVTVLKERLAR